MVGDGDGGGVFLYAPFSSAHYRSHCHRVLIIGAVSTDGIVSSSHHLIISSVRLISLVPRCPIISSRSGGVGACHLSSKQRRHGGPSAHRLIPSSQPIPVMERLARHLVSCVSSSVSNDTPGTSTSRRGRTKQANEHARTGRGRDEKRDEKPGSQSGRRTETRTARQRGRDDGSTRTASKQGQRRYATQS